MNTALFLIATFGITTAVTEPAGEVRCRETGFSQAVENQDQESFVSFIDPDARFVGSTVMRGPADIVEAWRDFFAVDGPRIKWRPRIVEVLDDGTLALTRGPYRMITTDADGNEIERWGTFNSVWRRHADGQWKIVFDAGSPPTESPSEEVAALLDADDGC